MKSTLAFAALLICACLAHAAQDLSTVADIPHLPPQHSTAFVCERTDKQQVVAVVVSYSNGQVIRFDFTQMHGFTVQQMMAYHDTAPDSRIYIVPCKQPEIT